VSGANASRPPRARGLKHPNAIARLVEPGTSGKWHGVNCYVKTFDGVNCYVKTFDGDTIEVRESVFEVMGLIKSTQEAKP